MSLTPYRVYGWLPDTPRPGNAVTWNAHVPPQATAPELAAYLNSRPAGQRVLIWQGLGSVALDPQNNVWGRGGYIPFTHPDELLSYNEPGSPKSPPQPYWGVWWDKGIAGVYADVLAKLKAVKAAGAKGIDLLVIDQEIDLESVAYGYGAKALMTDPRYAEWWAGLGQGVNNPTTLREWIQRAAIDAWDESVGAALRAVFPNALWTNYEAKHAPLAPVPSLVLSPAHYGPVADLGGLAKQLTLARSLTQWDVPFVPWFDAETEGAWFRELVWHVLLTYGSSRAFNFAPSSEAVRDELWAMTMGELRRVAAGQDLDGPAPEVVQVDGALVSWCFTRGQKRIVGRVTFDEGAELASFIVCQKPVTVKRGDGLGTWFAVTMNRVI